MNFKFPSRVHIFGFPVDPLTKPQFLDRASQIIEFNQKQQVITLYSSMLVWAQKDEEFARIIRENNLNLADGVGLLAAGDFLAKKTHFHWFPAIIGESIFQGLAVGLRVLAGRQFEAIPQRLRGVDLVSDFFALAAKKNWRIFLLGGLGRDTIELREKFVKEYPGVRVEADNGPLSIENSWPEDEQAMLQKINTFSPQILLVAFGPIKQEKWLAKNLPNLNCNMAMGVGGAFDLLAGRVKRAPVFWQKIGLEWLWRLLNQPQNLSKAWVAFPVFPLLVFREKLSRAMD